MARPAFDHDAGLSFVFDFDDEVYLRVQRSGLGVSRVVVWVKALGASPKLWGLTKAWEPH